MTTHHANRTRQIGIASERSVPHQAAGDLHVHHTAALEGSKPGLGSVAVPIDDVDHVIRGRDALLDELTAVTSEGGRIVVLHGAGGFGKTAIALSLAHRVLRSAHVWWVDATDRTSLANDLREVALRAGAPPRLIRQAWRGTTSAPEFHEVITRTSAVLGPEHPTTLCARHTLAVVSHATSDWAAAVAELRDILEIQLRTLGPRHPDTVASQHNLGVIGCPEWTPVTALGRGRDRIGVADALPGLAG